MATPRSDSQDDALPTSGDLSENPIPPDVVRLAPPLVITETQIDSFLAALPAVLDKAVQS